MQGLLSGIIVLFSICLQAQTEKIDSLLNDLFFNKDAPVVVTKKPIKYNFIFTGNHVCSNTLYAGRKVNSNMMNISAYVYYYSYTGLYMGASGVWYDHQAPGYSSTRITIGYNKGIDKNKYFTGKLSYSRLFNYLPDTIYTYPFNNTAYIGLLFRKKWLGARLYGNAYFGKDFKYNLTSTLYSRITLMRLENYNKLYTIPELSAFYGNEVVSTRTFSSLGFNETLGWEEVYGVLNAQAYLPLAIRLGYFDIEISCAINIPFTRDVNFYYPVQAVYSLTIGYLFPIPKRIRPLFYDRRR